MSFVANLRRLEEGSFSTEGRDNPVSRSHYMSAKQKFVFYLYMSLLEQKVLLLN